MFDPKNEKTAYAVGVVNAPNQDIHIFKSSDNGKTWKRIAKSNLFDNHEYWIHESILFNGKIYVYTHNGVLSYDPNNSLGIDTPSIENMSSSTAIFDLAGKKVTHPTPGNIYIHNGKKKFRSHIEQQ